MRKGEQLGIGGRVRNSNEEGRAVGNRRESEEQQ
jgi:hypothetical protein